MVAPKEEEVAAPAAAATPAEPELVGKEAAPAPEGEAGAQAKAPKAEAKPSAGASAPETQGSSARAGGAAGKPRGDKPGKTEKKE